MLKIITETIVRQIKNRIELYALLKKAFSGKTFGTFCYVAELSKLKAKKVGALCTVLFSQAKILL
jgi:hypothetical protein